MKTVSALRRKIARTKLAPLAAFPGRLSFVVRQNARLLGASGRWLVRSREHTNLTYRLTELNMEQMCWFVAQVTHTAIVDIRAYVKEVDDDVHLERHVVEYTASSARRGLADADARYARRAGWYAIVRATRPEVVVETGTDKGLGSCVLAAALLRNGTGELITLDINPESGYLIAPPYSTVTSRRVGDSVQVLTDLGRPVDIFIHDSDHSYEYESKEFAAVAPWLKSTSFVMSDNAHASTALSDWAEHEGWSFWFFAEKPQDHWYPGDGIGVATPQLD